MSRLYARKSDQAQPLPQKAHCSEWPYLCACCREWWDVGRGTMGICRKDGLKVPRDSGCMAGPRPA